MPTKLVAEATAEQWVNLLRSSHIAGEHVIEAEPDRLREVTGVGAVRAKRITDASNGVGTARAVRIFKTYGADAVQVMTENPYPAGLPSGRSRRIVLKNRLDRGARH